MTTELSIVIPTYNEAGNIEPLIKRLNETLHSINWEVIFVDDNSQDGTKDIIDQISRLESNIHVIHRMNKKGLSSACIEGFLACNAPIIAVMDADLQHDETLLVTMLKSFHNNPKLDVVIGSRFLKESTRNEFGYIRNFISNLGNTLSRCLIHEKLTDPLSGFFMIKKSVLEDNSKKLYGKGFKILLDIFSASNKKLMYKELPFKFGTRHSGESKLNSTVILEFLGLFLYKTFGRILSIEFLKFGIVGASGVIVHLTLLSVFFKVTDLSFFASQIIATLSAMTSNFIVNNAFTFKEKNLTGLKKFKGLIMFYISCSLAGVLNITISNFLYQNGLHWIVSALTGILLGSFLNYTLSYRYIWNKLQPKDTF